jgi:hypothetical protein
MNERINKLAKQAVFESYKAGCIDQKEILLEKFAELILQDIDRIINELYHAMPLEQASVLLTLDENIKEHFYAVKS